MVSVKWCYSLTTLIVTPIEEVLLRWPGLNRGIVLHITRKWGGRSTLDKSNNNLLRCHVVNKGSMVCLPETYIASPYNKYLTSFHFEGRCTIYQKQSLCMWKHRILHITPHAYLCHFCFELASQLDWAGHLAQRMHRFKLLPPTEVGTNKQMPQC